MTEIQKPPIADENIVFFDNVCNLCSRSVQFILRYNEDKSIKFASIQSALGQRVSDFYGLPSDTYETMLYLEDGLLYTKSTAALKIAQRLVLPWRLLRVFGIVPPGIRDWLYDRVARNRYRLFGRRDQCFLPDKDVLNRFLET